jgi:hypothetical protein
LKVGVKQSKEQLFKFDVRELDVAKEKHITVITNPEGKLMSFGKNCYINDNLQK